MKLLTVNTKYARKDISKNMASLILEGGTLRPIFSCGVMDALIDQNIIFPYVIGVSAGITYGMSYISKQKERNLEIVTKYRNDKRYLGIGNFKKYNSLFGLDFVYDEVPNKLCPFDWETFLDYKGTVLVGVTNANTGHIEYMNGKDLDEKCTMLRATCALPMLFPAIKINGVPYYDGGLADSIPIKKAIMDGNKKHLIVLTRTADYRKELTKSVRLTASIIGKRYPRISRLMLNRHIRYNKTVEFVNRLEQEGKAIVLRPEYELNSFEKDVNVLKETNRMGYELAMKRIDEIATLIQEL